MQPLNLDRGQSRGLWVVWPCAINVWDASDVRRAKPLLYMRRECRLEVFASIECSKKTNVCMMVDVPVKKIMGNWEIITIIPQMDLPVST